MPPRGISVEIPTWWTDDLDALMKPDAQGVVRARKTDLAMALIPEATRRAGGDQLERALNSARVKVSRFFEPNEDKRSRTIEIVEAWCAAFGLPRFQFDAVSRRQAVAMQLVQGDPDLVDRVITARTLEMSVDSGETRYNDLIRGHTQPVGSADGVVGRGPRGGKSGSKAPRGEQR